MIDQWKGGAPLNPEDENKETPPTPPEPEKKDETVPFTYKVSDYVGYDPAARRFFGKPVPEAMRCIALKRNCVCGYHYKRSDLFDENNKRKVPADPCPQCGRARARCANPSMKGQTVCHVHTGKATQAKRRKAMIPVRIHLDDDDIEAVERMVEEDDISLKREFHVLRMIFGKAMNEFQLKYRAQMETGLTDVIGAANKLSGMILQLAQIAEKRSKASEVLSAEDQLTRVEFEDPRVKYLIKEMIRDKEIETITTVLMAVLKALDPTGDKRVVERIPPSFYPYLPAEVVPQGATLKNADRESESG